MHTRPGTNQGAGCRLPRLCKRAHSQFKAVLLLYNGHAGVDIEKKLFRLGQKHADHEFENEDVRNCLKAVEVVATTSDSQNEEEVLEQWYSLYGLEVSRWILLALTLNMGSNLSKAWTLPTSFDVQTEHSWCYVN